MSAIEEMSKDTIGVIERLYKTETLLLLITIVLYIDCTLKIIYNKNVIVFDWINASIYESIPISCFCLLFFTLFASLIMPSINYIIVNIAIAVKKAPHTEENFKHYVRYHMVKQYSESSNNDILFMWCKSIESSEKKSDLLSKYSLSAIFFLCINLVLGISGTETISVLILRSRDVLFNAIIASIDGSIFSIFISHCISIFIYVSFIIMVIFIFGIWCKTAFYNKYDTYLWNDELAKLLNKERIEAEAQRREKILHRQLA